ncbi:MAG: TIGR04282 family arsenosugar biosynthesis glycosyltransferase [Anaerolineae bacterium]|nr:TIGR04282 family arsenosugar biosynthesis glycosyltransferase [Anaerolineae bacterium]
MDRALVVMAKEPQAGQTKTRLSPPLSDRQAAELYRCFLLDTLELMQRVGSVQPIIAYDPAEAEPFFRHFAPPGFDFIPQVGADLGERLDHVLTHCLQNGYRQAVVTDSDSPTLPLAYLRQAFSELDDPDVDVVLGPCDDGGYYLIGLKSPCSALFRGIAMSTSSVLADTLQRAREQGLRAVCLPHWYDVDTHEGLTRLAEELSSRPDHPAQHTRTFLLDTVELPPGSPGRS